MKSKGNTEVFILSLISIIALLYLTGALSNIISYFSQNEQHTYLTDITYPEIINSSSHYSTPIKFSIFITNPSQDFLEPYLEVNYKNDYFYSDNYFLKQNNIIPLERLSYGEKTVYYITFFVDYFYVQNIKGSYNFTFSLYNSSTKQTLLDSREAIVIAQ